MDDGPHRPVEQGGQSSNVSQPGPGIGPGGAEQHMVRLIALQDIIDQIGGEGDLPPAFPLARLLPLDQAADDCHLPKGPFQQVGI